MKELLFIEGVSGVGKSTMARTLAEALRARGHRVQAYLEFDYTNPIDFYCTAYLPLAEYEALCARYPASVSALRAHSIPAGAAWLVRYYNEDTPLFEEPLLSELARHEFCYAPTRLIPLHAYTAAYTQVWRDYTRRLPQINDDFILFDGSLLHHPINDMMRNYAVSGEQALVHVAALLETLGTTKRHILYLKTDDISEQLRRAHRDRGQSAPTPEALLFWAARYQNDRTVLRGLREKQQIYDVSHSDWDQARDEILQTLL